MRKQIFIFFTPFFFFLGVTAQDKYRAIHWTIDNGLSHSDNYNIIKDSKGFLWIGSGNGLNRFDGNTFKYYFSDTTQKTRIASNGIQGLSEDSLHNIWIGTEKGISCYDIVADSFTNLLSGDGVIPFWARKDEMLCWDYKEHAIISYNIHSFARKVFVRFSPVDSLGGRGTKFMYSIFDEAGKNIWMLTDEKKMGGLMQVSLIDGKRKFYFWPVNKKNRDGNHFHYTNAEAMRYDRKRNCIWINSPEGLINFTLSDKQFHPIGALDQYTNLKGYDRLVGIDFDTKGRIWFATQPKGIIIYDPADQSVELPFSNDSALQVDAGKFNACLYCDRDGIVWTGSWLKTGVYQIAPFSRTVSHYLSIPNDNHSLSDNAVVRFAQADKGKIWLGTFGAAINIFDPATSQFETLPVKDLEGIKPAGLNQEVAPVYIDTSERKAWIESNTIYEMDMITKKCRPVVFKDSAGSIINLSADAKTSSLPFKNGFATRASHDNRQGIFMVDRYSAIARELISFSDEEINPYIKVVNDRLLFITLQPFERGHLTYIYTGNKLIRTPTPLDSIQWSEIIFNKTDSTYWVTVERQLFHYSKDFRIIHKYTPKEGLPAIDVSCLTLDNSNNLWFHTDRSIHQLNTKTGEFSELSEKDGFEKMDFVNYPGSLKADNGDIYFPTGYIAQGFVRISPAKFVSPPSTVYVETIDINQKPISLLTGVNNLEQLSLPYFQNKINISTGILDFYSKGKSRIRYKLEGQDTNWQYSSYYSTIRYEGLPTGKKYRLLMQASNASNEFNGPIKSLLIYISPPFWNTWWFRIVAILLAVALLYGFIQYRSRNLKKRNILLEKKVTERTNELNNSLAELKTAQDQLIQSEKMASLGELTSGIAHEIKNPLNFINNFSEINMELITEIEEEQIPVLNENDQAEITENIKTLKKNSEKINHHGKRIDGIVKGMLQHSRLGNVNKELVNINALCDESLKLAYHGFRAKEKTFNTSFETRFDPDLPKIMVIPQDFGRVIINLINNAFYTVNEKKKKIQSQSSVDALQSESLYKPTVILSTKKSGDKIFISVSDNGMGIPPAIINKIFQPFYTTKPTGEGTGLGLSMSYDIITNSHGGELRAKSKEGLGTDFEIILPI